MRSVGCRHGTCQAPFQCICKEGYGGRHCQLGEYSLPFASVFVKTDRLDKNIAIYGDVIVSQPNKKLSLNDLQAKQVI